MRGSSINFVVKKSIRRKLNVNLLEDVPQLGPKSSVVSVSPGFMRNTLYPAKLASYLDFTLAVSSKLVEALHDMPINSEVLKQAQLDLLERFNTLDIAFNRSVTLVNSSSSNQTIHGSITERDILDKLSDEFDIKLSNFNAEIEIMETPLTTKRGLQTIIKNIGEYKVRIKFNKGLVDRNDEMKIIVKSLE
ncbi:hypothetical protein E3Q15_03851 [Wallemia mellicola]|nr:hypothetical protein E3Q15_03851 [Wallemia mellicola]